MALVAASDAREESRARSSAERLEAARYGRQDARRYELEAARVAILD
jgi:hypothetical protein